MAAKGKLTKACFKTQHRSVDVVGKTVGGLAVVHPIPEMGLGIVATDRILEGCRILAEEPIMTVRDDHKEARVFSKEVAIFRNGGGLPVKFETWLRRKVSTLDAGQQNMFWSLSDSHSRQGEKTAFGIIDTNVLNTSPFEDGLLWYGSHFNHSCKPNVDKHWCQDRRMFVFSAARCIHAGEELTIFYAHPKFIRRRIPTFTCGCSECCSKPERRFLKFEPGDIGMVCDPSTGQVMEVSKRGQSAIAGVRPGWVVTHINEGTYDVSLLNTYVQGSLSFTIALEVPVSEVDGLVGGRPDVRIAPIIVIIIVLSIARMIT